MSGTNALQFVGTPRKSGSQVVYGLARSWIVIAVIAILATAVLDRLGLNVFGYSQLVLPRTWFTLFVILHLGLCLTSFGRVDEVLRLSITPFLAQPYDVCLGWDVEAGALSLARMLPFLVLIAALILALARRRYRPSITELMLSAAALVICAVSWAVGSKYTMVGLTVTLFVGVLLPAFGMYIGSIARSRSECLPQFAAGLAFGIFILLFTFFASLGLATMVVTSRGEGTLESAREVGDFNSLISYLLLCWPFAVAYLRRDNRVLLALLYILFLLATFVGLSKTMMLLAPPLLIFSLPIAFPSLRLRTVFVGIAGLALLTWLAIQFVLTSPAGQLFLDLWLGRLDINPNAGSVSIEDLLKPVMVGGEAWDDRAILRAEAWRIFFEHPLTGTGWATFPFESRIQQGTSHSLTTDLLQQAGIFAAALFWWVSLEIGSRLVMFARSGAAQRGPALMFAASFGIWIIAAHTVGAQLFMAANTGFAVNALSGMVFVMLLRREVVAQLCRPAMAPA